MADCLNPDNQMGQKIEIDTLHLFPLLDDMLIQLLSSLTEDEWHMPTVAKLWTVKDVASHLLDGNLRALSISRDGYIGEKADNINSYQDLVSFLNHMNMSWTNATKRLSPAILIFLLEATGRQYSTHLNSVDLSANAVFPVAWAGQEISANWFHIAREYTEKFLHQQQIRDAVGKPGLMTKEFYGPFIETFMCAFPHTFRNVSAEQGTVVSLIVTGDIGGQWNIVKCGNDWELNKETGVESNATVKIEPDIAWKLFSKSLTPAQAVPLVEITGDRQWGIHALGIVAVMA